MVRFSATLNDGKVAWPTTWTRPIPTRLRVAREVTSTPLRLTVPASGRSRPPITLSSVLLPTPLGPSSATISPCSTTRPASNSTCTGPYDARMPAQESAGARSLVLKGHLGSFVDEVALGLVVLEHAVGTGRRPPTVTQHVAEAGRGLERAAVTVHGLRPGPGIEGVVGAHPVGAQLEQAHGVAVGQRDPGGLAGLEGDVGLRVDVEAPGLRLAGGELQLLVGHVLRRVEPDADHPIHGAGGDRVGVVHEEGRVVEARDPVARGEAVLGRGDAREDAGEPRSAEEHHPVDA